MLRSREALMSSLIAFVLFLAPAEASGAGAKEAWENEWENTVAAAKKEGQLDLLLSPNPLYLQDFQKAFPEIKITDHAAGGGSSARSKVLSERRAEKYLVDVNVGGPDTPFSVLRRANALDPIRPLLLLPEVTDQSKWFGGKHHYVDPEGQYIFLFEGTAQSYIAYNRNFLKRGEIESYWDLLDPKWKGKIVSYDPLLPGTVSHGTRFLYYHPELGPKLLRRLYSEMDVVIARDNRQMVDWVAQGKYAFCIFCRSTEVHQALKQGLPLAFVGPYAMKEGSSVVPVTGSVALMNRAPHPNAAKLFINWLLSREGQSAYQRSQLNVGGADSLRVDIPKSDVPPESRRAAEGKYFMSSRAEWIDMTPIHSLIKEALQAKAR